MNFHSVEGEMKLEQGNMSISSLKDEKTLVDKMNLRKHVLCWWKIMMEKKLYAELILWFCIHSTFLFQNQRIDNLLFTNAVMEEPISFQENEQSNSINEPFLLLVFISDKYSQRRNFSFLNQ